ncbi:MAG: hypothetical protein FJ109_04405 [Deltaproteobacteria bacterium]|nr:hypothetical protein [Deltaproteobacteria bacterium]
MSYDVNDYLLADSMPYPFCPGCSHGQVLDALGKALPMVGVAPNRVALVTDIGCIGISDKHFGMHTFHGLHGRSVTYASGLKLGNPDLTVIVLVGDGGLGLGGHHFLHAARRNVDITVLVCNNFNFGMTGGQHSVTTPHQAVTATTTEGNFEYPLDIAGLVDVAQGNFAARVMFHDPRLPDLIAEAIRSPGFAALDIWEMCTAYFAKRNKVSRSVLEEQLRERNLSTGIVVRRDRKGYVEQYRHSLEALQGKPLSEGTELAAEFPRPVYPRQSVLIAGRAGQKVRSTAMILGRAGVLSDLYVTQRDDYPVTVMTGHSTAEMVFQPDPVNELTVDAPDIVLITSEEGRDVIRERLRGLPPTSVVYALEELLPLDTPARVEPIAADAVNIQKKKTQIVLACVAWMAAKTQVVSLEALRRAAWFDERQSIADENLATLAEMESRLARTR